MTGTSLKEGVARAATTTLLTGLLGIPKTVAEEISAAYVGRDANLARQLLTASLDRSSIDSVVQPTADPEVSPWTQPDQAFFARHPDEVAKDLVGSMLVRHAGKDELIYLMVTQTKSWPEIVYKDVDGLKGAALKKAEDQRQGYTQEPGNIYWYKGSRGTVLAITAHEGKSVEGPGLNQGVVSLTGLLVPNSAPDNKELLTATKIVQYLGLDSQFGGTFVNQNGLWISRANFDLAAIDEKVVEKNPGKGDKYSKQYTLKL
ncbi:hypothetical protein HN587_01480 [Candidatus Woesearchaeota archaeon]|jgi:3-methyladenine DNA glycosylase Mpg|nr:hypothetical protein [Candidatus Woesearchaeota archaeon]